jgi:hypothetical protein
MKTETTCADMSCDRGVAERPRYYARQLITSDDLTLEQEYFRNKLRMHNRMLHGWGVVCGAQVCLVPKTNGNGNGQFEPWLVYVKPGYILSPCGDEISIDCGRVVDLRKSGVTGITGEPCVDAVDPWCVEVFEREGPDTLYLAVRYKQIATRPVRVQPMGCGCDDTRCENSRWRDGYEIKVLNYCPHTDEGEAPSLDNLFKDSPVPQCPTPPDDPWVGLAKIELDPDGVISRIDNCACRRLVLSPAPFWWHCQGPPEVEAVRDGGEVVEGEARTIKIEANRAFVPGTTVDLGPGITVNQAEVKPAADNNRIIEVPIKVEAGAKPGPRTATINLPNRQRVVQPNAITVKAPAAPAPEPAPPADKTAADASKKTGAKKTGNRDTAPLEDTLREKQ